VSDDGRSGRSEKKVKTIKLGIKRGDGGRTKIISNENMKNIEPILRELRKTSRKLRRLSKNGFEIKLTINN
jgi:hypothetical protein